MKADGSRRTRLARPNAIGHLAWSPDGKWLAFAQEGSREKIFIANVDGSGQVMLSPDGDLISDRHPAWSPDGQKIAFARGDRLSPGNAIFVMNSDGSGLTQLTTRGKSSRRQSYFYRSPTWSPDGQRLAFVWETGPLPDGHPSFEIYVMSADGSEKRRLTTSVIEPVSGEPGRVVVWNTADPVWSPDGTRIAYTSYREHELNVQAYLHVMNADGSGDVTLTSPGGRDEDPTWSPDSKFLAVTAFHDGNAEIDLVAVDGSGRIRLTRNEAYDGRPAWLPGGQKIVFVSNRKDRYSELYLMNADGSGQTRLNALVGRRSDIPSWVSFAPAPR